MTRLPGSGDSTLRAPFGAPRAGCSVRLVGARLCWTSTRRSPRTTRSVSASERLTLARARRSDSRASWATTSTSSAAPASATRDGRTASSPPRRRPSRHAPASTPHAGVNTWLTDSRGDRPRSTSARCSSTATPTGCCPTRSPPSACGIRCGQPRCPGSQCRVSIAREGAAASPTSRLASTRASGRGPDDERRRARSTRRLSRTNRPRPPRCGVQGERPSAPAFECGTTS
jgi:hypothetical protein